MPKPKAPKGIEPVTGVAFSIQASKDAGFSNFRIVVLFLVDGEVVHIEKTQEFAAFEAIARTEILIDSSLWNLSSRYAAGLYQGLGGDQRTELIKRLKKSNPEILAKIAPALGLLPTAAEKAGSH